MTEPAPTSKLRADFEAHGRDVPCIYCAGTPTRIVEVVPAQYAQGAMTHRAHLADLCWSCMRRLRIDRADRDYAVRQARHLKDSQMWARQTAREAMRANQTQLFDPDPGPDNAITKGLNHE